MRRILPILLLALVAACSKDKDPDRPAKLVAFPENLKIQKVWSEKVGGTKVPLRLGLALEVEGDTVYAAGEKGEIAAFNLQNGHAQWQTRTKLPLGGAVGFGDGKIVVGSTDGDVIALDAHSGKQLWSTNIAAEILAAPAVSPKLALVRGVERQAARAWRWPMAMRCGSSSSRCRSCRCAARPRRPSRAMWP